MSEGSIQLHPTLGVNARLTFCQQCGGDCNEILLMGNHNYMFTCAGCSVVSIGSRSCQECKSHRGCVASSTSTSEFHRRDRVAPVQRRTSSMPKLWLLVASTSSVLTAKPVASSRSLHTLTQYAK